MAKRRSKQKFTTRQSSDERQDLQPWLDYFDMLREYVNDGFLQVAVEQHECFVTQSALHAMSDGSNPLLHIRNGTIEKTAQRLRTYAAWLSAEGEGYMREPFAVNVVRHDEPHDPVYTILLTQKRRMVKWNEKIEIIIYTKKNEIFSSGHP